MKWTIEMSNNELTRKAEPDRVVENRSTQKEGRQWMARWGSNKVKINTFITGLLGLNKRRAV